MNISPELAAKKAAGKRYDELLASHPELKPRAMALIDQGKTLAEIVNELDDQGKAGWARVTAKLNKQTDALLNGAKS